MQDGNDDDLLGGGGDFDGAAAGGEEITEFESSFPAVDTRNNVSRIRRLRNVEKCRQG